MTASPHDRLEQDGFAILRGMMTTEEVERLQDEAGLEWHESA